MSLVLAAVLGALAVGIIGPLLVAAPEVRLHNRQVEERDEDLEEWIVVRQRQLVRRLREIEQDANAKGVLGGGTMPAARAAVKTNLLYDYREELRQARAFVRNVQVEERWYHGIARLLSRRRFPALTVPDRAERLVDYWAEGTARKALTWSLDDILEELPVRATSRALEPGIDPDSTSIL